jgi:hypothetical protein
MKWYELALFATVTIFLIGCQFYPCYTTKQPNPSDLVGVYQPTRATKKMLTQEMAYTNTDAYIILRSDGAFEMHKMPDCWLTRFGKPNNQYDFGQGCWTVRKKYSTWFIDLSFDDALGLTSVKDWQIKTTWKDGSITYQSGKASGFGAEAGLIGNQPPYRIYLTVGAPDSGIGLEFERHE